VTAAELSPSIEERLRNRVRGAVSRRFVLAWLRWRRDRLMPNRSALDIADIRDLLASVALVEVAGPDEMRLKVAGTRLRDYANFEATGMSLADITPPDHWPIRRYRMMQMAAWPCGGVSLKLDRRTAGSGVPFEIVTLPIMPDESGAPHQLITCVVPIGGKSEPPVPDRKPVMLLADHFDFLDIGAGTPDRTAP
jgi:hypothetical protein